MVMYKIRPNTPVLAKFAYMKKVNSESVGHIYVLDYILTHIAYRSFWIYSSSCVRQVRSAYLKISVCMS